MTDIAPRVLLVEDDPVSAAFLQAALERIPARVDIASSCGRARALQRTAAYDLFVFDANLPDGRGDALIRELRAAGDATPAIAHTASREAGEHEKLLEAGFLEVLAKPLSASEIVSAAQLALGMSPSTPHAARAATDAPLWDDEAALQALLGDRSHLDALRRLFILDLRSMRAGIAKAVQAGDAAALRGMLHRLRASCGFVGAAKLGLAARSLSVADPRAEWPVFDQVAACTIEAVPLQEE